MSRAKKFMRQRWVWLLTIATPFIVFLPATLNLKVLAPRDGYLINIPWYKMAADAWSSGSLPAWNRFSFAGTSLLSMQQAAVFSPSVLMYALLPISIATNLNVLSGFVIATFGAALLAKCFVPDKRAWLAAGFAYGFSNFFFGHISHPAMLITFAYLPLLCATYLRLLSKPTWRRFMAALAVHTLALLSGHGQAFLMSELYFVGFVVGDAVFRHNRDVKRRFFWAGLVLVCAAGLGAIQLIPSAIYATSGRDHFSFRTAMSFSYPTSHGLLYLFPRAFSTAKHIGPFPLNYRGMWNTEELSGYVSVLALMLAALGAYSFRRNRHVRVFIGLGIFGLLLAFARATPLSRLVYNVPVLGQFRSWARYTVYFSLSIAILTAYGMQAIILRRISRKQITTIGLIVAVCALAMVASTDTSGVHRYLPKATNHFWLFGPTFIFIGLSAGILYLARKHARAIALVPVVILIDVFLSVGITSEWVNVSPSVKQVNSITESELFWGPVYNSSGGLDRYLEISRRPDAAFRYDSYLRTDLMGIYSANGLDPLAPQLYRQRVGNMTPEGVVTNPAQLLAPNSWIPDVLRISSFVIDERAYPKVPPTPHPSTARVVSQDSFGQRPVTRFNIQPRLEDIYGVGAVRQVSSDQIMNELAEGTVDLNSVALIETQCNDCPNSAAKVDISQKSWGQNSISFTSQSDQKAFVVISNSLSKGWRATVDGKTATVYRTNGLVQGLVVPAGTHSVFLHYSPPGIQLGASLTVLTILSIGIAYVRQRRRRPRPIEMIDIRDSIVLPVPEPAQMSH